MGARPGSLKILEIIIKIWVSMDGEFIFQVKEEELAQFPEGGIQSEEEQNQQKKYTGIGSKGQGNPGIHKKTGKRR